MEVMELLTQAVEQNAADIFLVPGMPFSYKIGGRIICQGEEKIMPDEMDQMITRIYEIAKNRSMERILSHGDDDFSFAIPGVSRFRANIFRQRGSLAAVIRVVRFELPDASQLNLPDVIMGIAKLTRGLVFHKKWIRKSGSCSQWKKIGNLRKWNVWMWKKIRFSRTYPQVINKLWIMWAKIYTIHTGASIHIFFPVFLKKSLD